MLESFTCETFRAHLGNPFTVRLDDGTSRQLRLVEAKESPVNPGFEGRRVPFSIVFVDPGAEVLPQRIYPMQHDTLGAFELFVVPISAGPEGVRYEAVFS